jgi:hypothetical protein
MANGTPGAPPTQQKRPGLPVALWLIEAFLVAFWIYVVVTGLSFVGPAAHWGLAVVITMMLFALAGREVNGQWFGILIDSRNKLSLARLQMTLWTVMVLTAFLTMAIHRIRATTGVSPSLTHEQALDIKLPPELILAMGISLASFAGATLIKSAKTTREVKIEARNTPMMALDRKNKAKVEFDAVQSKVDTRSQEQFNANQALEAANTALKAAPSDTLLQKAQRKAEELAKAAVLNLKDGTDERDAKKKALEEAEAELKAIDEAQGLLHKNADPGEASWVDLVRGEEIGNYKLVDMSKVQMLFFTVVVIVAYATAVSNMLGEIGILMRSSLSFPDFNDTLNALLGISHGTYLSVKAVPHS